MERASNRQLTFLDGIGIIVGIIIGSGIFSSPGLALERAGSPALTLLSWSVASMLVGLTCQCYFELSCMMPSAGGDYEYLDRTYGNRVAFSFAWFNFFISKPGSQAIIATIFGHYFETFVTGKSSILNTTQDNTSNVAKTAAIALITTITLINCYGLKESAIFQNILTSLKLLLVTLIVIISFTYSGYYPKVIRSNLSIESSFDGSNGVVSFGSAMIACLWSFDGWADIIFLVEDLAEPYKQLPRIVLTSLCIVTVSFILVNICYFSVLDQNQIKSSPAIAYQVGLVISDKMEELAALPAVLAFGVALSAGGSCHGSIMAGGKGLHAVARDGRAPKYLARLSRKGTPYIALLCQGFWGVVLLSLPSSNFASLLDYFGPASWFFYALTSSSVITLRIREPSRSRPYKLPLYPLPVLLVIFVAAVIIISSFATEPLYTSLAFSFILLSWPVHYLLEKYQVINESIQRETRGEHDDEKNGEKRDDRVQHQMLSDDSHLEITRSNDRLFQDDDIDEEIVLNPINRSGRFDIDSKYDDAFSQSLQTDSFDDGFGEAKVTRNGFALLSSVAR